MNTGQKILIIEDEFIIANQLKNLLESEGYTIIGPSDDYNSSVSLIAKEMPDLIIADIRLHDDGEAGIKISEYVSKHYHIPVIFLSGYSDEETIHKARQTTPNTFLIKPKPLDKIQLLATVKMALPHSISATKLKAISLKGKELDICEDYNHLKEKEKIDYIIRVIDTDEITFIETYNHYFKNTLLIRFNQSKTGFLIREEIENIQKKLPHTFLRVHKSYLVNMKRIDGYRLPHYLLIHETSIPIGHKYQQEIEFYLGTKIA